MNLTQAQLGTLKTWLDANAAGLDDEQAKNALNALANPAFVVWRGPLTPITPAEYMGPSGLAWTAVDGLQVGKARIFEWMTRMLSASLNASDSNIRQGMSDCFGAGATLTNLTALAKRNATVAEKLFATGTGTTASPATMAGAATGISIGLAEGQITVANVSEARNLT